MCFLSFVIWTSILWTSDKCPLNFRQDIKQQIAQQTQKLFVITCFYHHPEKSRVSLLFHKNKISLSDNITHSPIHLCVLSVLDFLQKELFSLLLITLSVPSIPGSPTRKLSPSVFLTLSLASLKVTFHYHYPLRYADSIMRMGAACGVCALRVACCVFVCWMWCYVCWVCGYTPWKILEKCFKIYFSILPPQPW